MFISKKDLFDWCESQAEEQISLLTQLAAIPAPSHCEHKRASFIQRWLKNYGAEDVTTDSALNVILRISAQPGIPMLVCMAHTDIVFSDTGPLPVKIENGKIHAPGVGDDTANVVALMLCAKFFLTHPKVASKPMLFVFNSCEEGLGNLKGVRQIMSDYGEQVREFVSFDCQFDSIITRAVGSERWQVKASTTGGHSYSDFGNPNAIHQLSMLISNLYRQGVPQKKGTKTTFNVGLISGGTSVNTIAQNAEMTYEYRSDDLESLSVMAQQFKDILEKSRSQDVDFTVESIGNRPCGAKILAETHNILIQRAFNAIKSVTFINPVLCAASTDANIPLSMGIPAITFGLYRGGGAHTREEYVDLDSLVPGLKIALTFLLSEKLTD